MKYSGIDNLDELNNRETDTDFVQQAADKYKSSVDDMGHTAALMASMGFLMENIKGLTPRAAKNLLNTALEKDEQYQEYSRVASNKEVQYDAVSFDELVSKYALRDHD